MEIDLYQIDAFTSKVFEGNPAAIIPLDEWLPLNIMQAIANENNLSETAFFIPSDNSFEIRWFTPEREVDLCGHATLAAAYVIFNILNYDLDEIKFNSLSGLLTVKKNEDFLTLNFPSQVPVECDSPKDLIDGLGKTPAFCYRNQDYLAVYDNFHDIFNISPDFKKLMNLDLRGVIITAPGLNCDFISRFFVPKYGINEDPVTGSAHTQLTPYWCDRLGKEKLHAKQVSSRGGVLLCEQIDNRVLISGTAIKYLEGKIEIGL
mgnify:CR=1 FL=1